ncbi:DoxX family protein [Hymenobacter sp. 102]|uniref:DoxX family protein n=1 Tax=Hymenobacter sp. 102 TaxID=3403152 RepID=UPI003CF0BC03
MSASTRNIIAWILQGLLALAFIASGGRKLLDMPGTVGMFGQLGMPAVLAYMVAIGEVVGGIGLLIPRFVRLAAAGLLLIMIGAVIMHATKIPGGLTNGVPAMVLLALLLVVLWLRRPATTVA